MSRERAPHSQLLQNSSGLGVDGSAVRWNQTAVRQYEQGSRAAITAALILLGITASSLRVTVAARATGELLRGSLRLRPNS
jgi:hypothetical protein